MYQIYEDIWKKYREGYGERPSLSVRSYLELSEPTCQYGTEAQEV